MPSPKMKHCPFCGENNVRMIKRSKGGPELEVVECANCGASVCSPLSDPQYAVRLWNTRVLDVSVDELQIFNRFIERAIADRMREVLRAYGPNGFSVDLDREILWPLENASNANFRITKLITALMGERPLIKEKKK